MSYIKLIICLAVISTASIGNDIYAQTSANDLTDLGIDQEVQEDLVLKVFPNPTPDFVTIQSNLKLQGNYKLSNIVGKVLLEGAIEDHKLTIDLLKFRSGVFIISIYDTKGKQLATRKIIKN